MLSWMWAFSYSDILSWQHATLKNYILRYHVIVFTNYECDYLPLACQILTWCGRNHTPLNDSPYSFLFKASIISSFFHMFALLMNSWCRNDTQGKCSTWSQIAWLNDSHSLTSANIRVWVFCRRPFWLSNVAWSRIPMLYPNVHNMR